VLRVEALRRISWMGRTGEDGVALRSRRCEACRCGGLARTKLLRMLLLLSRLVWLKLLSVSHLF
jgi:hypothetical protein